MVLFPEACLGKKGPGLALGFIPLIIGYYVVDFFCNEVRLIVELDGSIHDYLEQKAYDKKRQKHLESKGFTIIRFRNWQVFGKKDWVLSLILSEINKIKQSGIESSLSL